MRTYDLTPLWRSTVGVDRLFHLINNSVRWPAADRRPVPDDPGRAGEQNGGAVRRPRGGVACL